MGMSDWIAIGLWTLLFGAHVLLMFSMRALDASMKRNDENLRMWKDTIAAWEEDLKGRSKEES